MRVRKYFSDATEVWRKKEDSSSSFFVSINNITSPLTRQNLNEKKGKKKKFQKEKRKNLYQKKVKRKIRMKNFQNLCKIFLKV